jgi:hypothetical protein
LAGGSDAQRARLAEIDGELTRLRYRHDIAMSAFRFEEATSLGPAISALEKERAALAASVPPPDPPAGVIPTLATPRMLRRRR